MALDLGPGARSGSPESSGRDSPIPPQWRNQLGAEEYPVKDKIYRRYASGVEKALQLFETALEEWADYISFLNKLLKALQARPSSYPLIPSKATVAKRLSQCLNPSLPSGVHQKALEVYKYVFEVIGKDGLSRDLPLYFPGLAPTLSFASLSVRSPYLDLLERHLIGLASRSLRPAMKSVILALLPGLEDETSEDFDRTLQLLAKFKEAIRPDDKPLISEQHSSGDDFFWQCFFLASVTSQSRRSGALAYLVRNLPVLGSGSATNPSNDKNLQESLGDGRKDALTTIVASPEPGLLIRCFASGLSDDQLLIQRGFLDLLVTHLPLNSRVLQSRVKTGDLELLLRAAVGVVTRRDMSLNRRLWTWLLGPEPTGSDGDHHLDLQVTSPDHGQVSVISSRTQYFEEFGLRPLTESLLDMIKQRIHGGVAERTRPYRICLSLMDRWEIGSLVIPEIFLPVIESVQQFKTEASEKSEFTEVLRSASVFFDGIESGLIYSELVGILARAIGPENATDKERSERLSLFNFIITNFNVREEEMVTIHSPLTCLAALLMLENWKSYEAQIGAEAAESMPITEQVLGIVVHLLELIPDRAFPASEAHRRDQTHLSSLSDVELLKRIRNFYIHEQGSLEASSSPFTPIEFGGLLLDRAVRYTCEDIDAQTSPGDLNFRIRILLLLLTKVPKSYKFDEKRLLSCVREQLGQKRLLSFSNFSSILHLVTQLYLAERIFLADLTALVDPLVRHAWSYLSASEPKYHVETVRCLWHLQTALTTSCRDIEASLASILVNRNTDAQADVGRAFGVLWSHTLQDSHSDRRGLKSLTIDSRPAPKIVGVENYEVMLAQPLFLILDALLDERTQLYMTVKSWLNNMVGIDRLFLLFVIKMSEMHCLKGILSGNGEQSEKADTEPLVFTEDDDLDLCLYYLRTLYHVLSCSREASSAVLASKKIHYNESQQIQILAGGEEQGITLQDYFVRVCKICITGDASPSGSAELHGRVTQLHRYVLTILHHFLLGQYAAPLSNLQLDTILLDKLLQSISSPDPYVQVLLLDVIFDALKLREASPVDLAAMSGLEKRRFSIDPLRASRPSLSVDIRPSITAMPPQLLKCLQAGLSSPSSQFVLDAWVSFLSGCLPFFSQSIFQILIPLITTLCNQIDGTFSNLKTLFRDEEYQVSRELGAPESTLIHLLNALEQVLARAHDQLMAEEARAQLAKSPDQPQSLFGSMVSGVFQTDTPQTRSATANDRLTVHLAFQDAVRICFKIWSWGQGKEAAKQDIHSSASFNYTSLRMRNRARRLLEHLSTAETLESLETVIDICKGSSDSQEYSNVFNFLQALDSSRPRYTMPALFNSIYSRTNPGALEPSRKSTMTISLEDADLVVFLVEYSRSLDDDAMSEIWQDCITFLRDLLGNPFPHRQTLPSLLEFAAILGEKVDNTNFGEQRKMRRELSDLFLRLLATLFTTRPTFAEPSGNGMSGGKSKNGSERQGIWDKAIERSDDAVAILTSIVPNLPKILLEPDRVLSAAGTISTNVIGPILRSKAFPNSVPPKFAKLLHELSRLQNNHKTWKKDIGDAFSDNRFFSTNLSLVRSDWLPLLRQWTLADKERMPDIIGRISSPTTAGIVFGVGATSARLEADRKTQLNLRRIATLVLASAEDHFVTDIPAIFDKLVELLAATSTSSPSSATRAEVYMVVRALVLKTSSIHLAVMWPVINAEIHAAISSVVAPDHSPASEIYVNTAVLQACKLLDLLICLAPDDFQLHEWLFVTDTIDAVYRSSTYQPVALIDEISEELDSAAAAAAASSSSSSGGGGGGGPLGSSHDDAAGQLATSISHHRRPLLGPGGISDEISLERKDELVAKILRPFFGQLSIFAFESTYAMGTVDREACIQGLLKDVFDDRSMVKAL